MGVLYSISQFLLLSDYRNNHVCPLHASLNSRRLSAEHTPATTGHLQTQHLFLPMEALGKEGWTPLSGDPQNRLGSWDTPRGKGRGVPQPLPSHGSRSRVHFRGATVTSQPNREKADHAGRHHVNRDCAQHHDGPQNIRAARTQVHWAWGAAGERN